MELVETGRDPAADRSAAGGERRSLPISPRTSCLILGGVVLVGLALRLLKFWDSVYADELSTLYIVRGRSLGDAISLVSSDAEVTPPLSFIASWLFRETRLRAGADPVAVSDRRHDDDPAHVSWSGAGR